MDTETCRTCGGYGENYIDIGPTDHHPQYELRTCQKCLGNGHHPIGGFPIKKVNEVKKHEAMEYAVRAMLGGMEWTKVPK